MTRCVDRIVGLLVALGAVVGLIGPDNAGPEEYLFVLYVLSRLFGFLGENNPRGRSLLNL